MSVLKQTENQMADANRELAKLAIGNRNMFLTANRYNGYNYVHIRYYFHPKSDDGEENTDVL